MSGFECEMCGKLHDGEYGSGRFCSAQCARSFSTKHDRSEEQKSALCIDCGKEIAVNKRSSLTRVVCASCRAARKQRKCKICGEPYIYEEGSGRKPSCKRPDVCKAKKLFKSLEHFGFDTGRIGTEAVIKEFDDTVLFIANEYQNGKSLPDLVREHSYPDAGTLAGVFKRLSIPLRTHAEAGTLAWSQGKQAVRTAENWGKQSYHTSWEGNTYLCRSTYETAYCEELDRERVSYEMETLRLQYWDSEQQKYRTAIPDFYLRETNTIVEVKSTWTLDLQEMKDRKKAFLQMGYNFVLMLDHEKADI